MKFNGQKLILNIIDFLSKALVYSVPIYGLIYSTYVTFRA